MPCNPCNEKAKPSLSRDIALVTLAKEFNSQVLFYVNMHSQAIADGKLDPVTARLILRRDLGVQASHAEGCGSCRKDIDMSVELDQFMIDAKQARSTYLQSKPWKALGMFAKFEKNVIVACFKWVPWLKWATLAAGAGLSFLLIRWVLGG